MNKYLMLSLSLFPITMARAMEKPAISREISYECTICGKNGNEVQPEQRYQTSCCNTSLCLADANEIERRAHELYLNLQNPKWRRRTSSAPDFEGWPRDAQEHAKCPYCRHCPLAVKPSEIMRLPKVEEKKVLTCSICFEDNNEKEFKNLSCNHSYCNECLNNLIDTAIRDKSTVQLKCPHPDCKRPIDEQEIRNITNNNLAKLNAYGDITTQEWLAQQNNARHCPTANCPYLFIRDETHIQSVTCPQCSIRYCSNCLFDHEQGISCKTAENSRISDHAYREWKRLNTKECPKCHATIEKNGGCPTVTCFKCQQKFCWYCLGLYDHAPHACNAREPRDVNPHVQPLEAPRIRLPEPNINAANNQRNNQRPETHNPIRAPQAIHRAALPIAAAQVAPALNRRPNVYIIDAHKIQKITGLDYLKSWIKVTVRFNGNVTPEIFNRFIRLISGNRWQNILKSFEVHRNGTPRISFVTHVSQEEVQQIIDEINRAQW